MSAILAAEAETEFRQGEDDGYNRPGPDVIALSQAADQAAKLARMVVNPVRYLYEIEYPPILSRVHYAAVAGVISVTVLVAAYQSLFKLLAGAVLAGVMALFLAAVIFTMMRTLFPSQNATLPVDLENVFGPNDLEIFKDFRRKFWDGEHDFSDISKIENISLKLALVSETIYAYNNGMPVSAGEIEKFEALLKVLKQSNKPRLISAAEKLLDERPYQTAKVRKAEGASLGSRQSDAEVFAGLKKIFEDAAVEQKLVKLIKGIQLEDLKYPKDGLIVSGDKLGNQKFSSENLYGISIPEDASGYSGDIMEAYIKDNALHLVVADAVNHGLSASFNRYLFQCLIRHYPLEEASRIFSRLHQQLRAQKPNLLFGIRYFELKLDLERGKILARTATAVNDQLIENLQGQMSRLEILDLEEGEQMIGMMRLDETPSMPSPWHELMLKDGFLILLQTDGAYEARNAQKKEFELERIKVLINEMLAKNPKISAKAVVEGILSEVKAHLGSARLSDDITLLVLRMPKFQASSLGISEQKDFDKFQIELRKGKVADQRLKEIVDRAEAAGQFDYLRKVFLSRLFEQDVDIFAYRGLKLLNAREAMYRELFGMSVPTKILDGGSVTVRAVAFSPDKKRFASGTSEGLVKIWDVETGRLVFRFDEKGFSIKSLDFNSNGSQICAEGADFSSRIWKLGTGQKIFFPAPSAANHKLFDADIRPINLKTHDGTRLVAVNRMGDVDVWQWDEKNPRKCRVLYGIKGQYIFSADVSADGRYFVTGSRDGRIVVWDFETDYPRQRAYLAGHESCVYSIKFSPDSRWLISGSQDQTVKLWQNHGRKLDGFWSRFQMGFALTDEEVRNLKDFLNSLDPRQQGNLNYEERAQLEAYALKWQQDIAVMVGFQGERLARQPDRDPKWKDDPSWLVEALVEYLKPSTGILSAYSMDKLEEMEEEMRAQLKISRPRPLINTYWNDAQNILLVLELLRRHDHIFKLPNPEFPKASGASLGAVLNQAVQGLADFRLSDIDERDKEILFGHILEERFAPVRAALESREGRAPLEEMALGDIFELLSEKRPLISDPPLPVTGTPLGDIDLSKLNDVTRYEGYDAAAQIARDLMLAHYLGLIRIKKFKGAVSPRTVYGQINKLFPKGKIISVNSTVSDWLRIKSGLRELAGDYSRYQDDEGQIAFYERVFGGDVGEKHLGNLYSALPKAVKRAAHWSMLSLNYREVKKLREAANTLTEEEKRDDEGQILFYERVFGDEVGEKHLGALYSALPKAVKQQAHWSVLNLNYREVKQLREAANTLTEEEKRDDEGQ
ncbi:MAG: SpoIIE family protein phosphatase, partial [Candidatus Omnitrophica bacterium]|nr:SpoIIE family protein phosphatase [Candidatus Omnitrophota bacterium]